MSSHQIMLNNTDFDVSITDSTTAYELTKTDGAGNTVTLSFPVPSVDQPIRDIAVMDGGDSVVVWALTQDGRLTVSAHDPDNLTLSLEASAALTNHVIHGAPKFVAIERINGQMVMVDAEGFVHSLRYEGGLATLTRSAEPIFDPANVEFDRTQPLQLEYDASNPVARKVRLTQPGLQTEWKSFDVDQVNTVAEVRDGIVTLGGANNGTKLVASNGHLLVQGTDGWQRLPGFADISSLEKVNGGVLIVERENRISFIPDDADLTADRADARLIQDFTSNDASVQASFRTDDLTFVLDQDGRIHIVPDTPNAWQLSQTVVTEPTFAPDNSPDKLKDIVVRRMLATEPGQYQNFPFEVVGVTHNGDLVRFVMPGSVPGHSQSTPLQMFVNETGFHKVDLGDDQRISDIQLGNSGKLVVTGDRLRADPGNRSFLAEFDHSTNRLSGATREIHGGSIGMPLQISHGDIRVLKNGQIFTLVDNVLHFWNAQFQDFESTGLKFDEIRVGADDKLYGLYEKTAVVPLDELGRAYVDLHGDHSDFDIMVSAYSIETGQPNNRIRDFTVDKDGKIIVLFEDGTFFNVDQAGQPARPNDFFFSTSELLSSSSQQGQLTDPYPPSGDRTKFYGGNDVFGGTPDLRGSFAENVVEAIENDRGERLVRDGAGRFWHGTPDTAGQNAGGAFTWQQWNLPPNADLTKIKLSLDASGELFVSQEVPGANGGPTEVEKAFRGNAQGVVRELKVLQARNAPPPPNVDGGGGKFIKVVIDKDQRLFAIHENGTLYSLAQGSQAWGEVATGGRDFVDLDISPTGRALGVEMSGRVFEALDFQAGNWSEVDRYSHAITAENLFSRSTSDSKSFNFDANILRMNLDTSTKKAVLEEAERSAQVILAGLKDRNPRGLGDVLYSNIYKPTVRRFHNFRNAVGSGLSALGRAIRSPLTTASSAGSSLFNAVWSAPGAIGDLYYHPENYRLLRLQGNLFSFGNSLDAYVDVQAARREHKHLVARLLGRRRATLGSGINTSITSLAATSADAGGRPINVFNEITGDMEKTLDRLIQEIGVNRDDWGSSQTKSDMAGQISERRRDNALSLLINDRERIVSDPANDALLNKLKALKDERGVFIGTSNYERYGLLVGKLMSQQDTLFKLLMRFDSIEKDGALGTPQQKAEARKNAARTSYEAYNENILSLVGKTEFGSYGDAQTTLRAFAHFRNNLQYQRHRVSIAAGAGGKLTENRADKYISWVEGMADGDSFTLNSNWRNTFRPAFRAIRFFDAGYSGATIYAGAKRTRDYSIKVIKTEDGFKMSIGGAIDWAGILKARPWSGESGTFSFDVDYDFSVGLEAGKVWSSDATFSFKNGEEDKLQRVLKGLFSNDLTNRQLLELADDTEKSSSTRKTKVSIGLSVGSTLLHGNDQGDLGPNDAEFIASNNIDGAIYDQQVFYAQNMIYGPNAEYVFDMFNSTDSTTWSFPGGGAGDYSVSVNQQAKWFSSHGWDVSLIGYQRFRGQGRELDGNGDVIQRLGMPIEPVLGSLSLNGKIFDRSKRSGIRNYSLNSTTGYKMAYTTEAGANGAPPRDVVKSVSYSVTFARDASVFEIERIKELLTSLPKPQADQLRNDLLNMVSFTTEANRNEIAGRLDQIVAHNPDLAPQVEFLKQVSEFKLPEEKALFERQLRSIVEIDPGAADLVARIVDENLHENRWRPDNGATLSISMELGADEIAKLNNPQGDDAHVKLKTRIARAVADPGKVRLKEISASETYSSKQSEGGGLWAEYKGGASLSAPGSTGVLKFSETARGLKYFPSKKSGKLFDESSVSFIKPVQQIKDINTLRGREFWEKVRVDPIPQTQDDLAEAASDTRHQLVLLEMDRQGTLDLFMSAAERMHFENERNTAIDDDTKKRRRQVIDSFFRPDAQNINEVQVVYLLTQMAIAPDSEEAKDLRAIAGMYNRSVGNAQLDQKYPKIGTEAGQGDFESLYLVEGEVYFLKPDSGDGLSYAKVPQDILQKIVLDRGRELLLAMNSYETGLLTLNKPLSEADKQRLGGLPQVTLPISRRPNAPQPDDLNNDLDVLSVLRDHQLGTVLTPAQEYILIQFLGADSTGQKVNKAALERLKADPAALADFERQVNLLQSSAFDANELSGMTPREAMLSMQASNAARQRLASDFARNLVSIEQFVNQEGVLDGTAFPHRTVGRLELNTTTFDHSMVSYFTAGPWRTQAMTRAHFAMISSGSPTSLMEALETSSLIETLKSGELASAEELLRQDQFKHLMFAFQLDAAELTTSNQSLNDVLNRVMNGALPADSFMVEIQGEQSSISLGKRIVRGQTEFFIFDPLVGETVISGTAVDHAHAPTATQTQKNALKATLSQALTTYLDMDSGRVGADGNPIRLADHYGINRASLTTTEIDPQSVKNTRASKDLFVFMNGVEQPGDNATNVSEADKENGYFLDRDRIDPDKKVTLNGYEIKVKTLYDMGAMLGGERIKFNTPLDSETVQRDLKFDPTILSSYLKTTAQNMGPRSNTLYGKTIGALQSAVNNYAPILPQISLAQVFNWDYRREAERSVKILRNRIAAVKSLDAVLNYDSRSGNYTTAANMLGKIKAGVSAGNPNSNLPTWLGTMGTLWERLADTGSSSKVTAPGSLIAKWGNRLDAIVGRVGLLQSVIGVGNFVRAKGVREEVSPEDLRMQRIAYTGLGLDLGSGILDAAAKRLGDRILAIKFKNTKSWSAWRARSIGQGLKANVLLAGVSVGLELYTAATAFMGAQKTDDASAKRFLRVNGGLSALGAATSLAMVGAMIAGSAFAAVGFGIAGAVVALSSMIYNAVKVVQGLQENYDLEFGWKDKAREGFRAFLGLDPSRKVIRARDRKSHETRTMAMGLDVIAEEDAIAKANLLQSASKDAGARVAQVVYSFGDALAYEEESKKNVKLEYRLRNEHGNWVSHERDFGTELEITYDEARALLDAEEHKLRTFHGNNYARTDRIIEDDWIYRQIETGPYPVEIETYDRFVGRKTRADGVDFSNGGDWNYSAVSSGDAEDFGFVGSAAVKELDLDDIEVYHHTGGGNKKWGVFSRKDYEVEKDYVLFQLGGTKDNPGGTDTITGRTDMANMFNIYAGRHDVTGGDKDDTFLVHKGPKAANPSILRGGAGSDMVVLLGDGANSNATSTIYLYSEQDEADGVIAWDYPSETAHHDLHLIGIENVSGMRNGADVIWGNDENNVIDGRGGNDELLGGGGEDVLIVRQGDRAVGGSGNDLYIVKRGVDEAGEATSGVISIDESNVEGNLNSISLEHDLSEVSEAVLKPVWQSAQSLYAYDVEITLQNDGGNETKLLLRYLYSPDGKMKDRDLVLATRDGFSLIPQFQPDLSVPKAGLELTDADLNTDLVTTHQRNFDGRFALRYRADADISLDPQHRESELVVQMDVEQGVIEVYEGVADAVTGEISAGALLQTHTLPDHTVLVGEGSRYSDNITGGVGSDILRGYDGQDTLSGGDGGDTYVIAINPQEVSDPSVAVEDYETTDTGEKVIVNQSVGQPILDEEGNPVLDEAGEPVLNYDMDIIVIGLRNDDIGIRRDENAPDDVILYYAPAEERAATVRLKDFMLGEAHRHIMVMDADQMMWTIELDQYGEPVFGLGIGEGSDPSADGSGEENGADEPEAVKRSVYMDGLGGDDTLRVDSYVDEAGNHAGGDILNGGEGNDLLIGGRAASELFGDVGDDVLLSYEADDILATGFGNDIVDLNSALVEGVKLIDTASIQDENGNNTELNRIIIPFSLDDPNVEMGHHEDSLVIYNKFTPTHLNDSRERELALVFSGYFADTAKRAIQLEFYASETTSDYENLGTPQYMISAEALFQKATLVLPTDSDDTVFLTPEHLTEESATAKVFEAGDGHDVVVDDFSNQGSGVVHKIYGGAGSDHLYAREGDDHVEGNDGNDVLFGEEGADSLYGGTGDDYVEDYDGDNLLYGGEGNDTLQGAGQLFGGLGSDDVVGSELDDRLHAANAGVSDAADAVNHLFGAGGNDRLTGSAGVDYLNGGDGDDSVWGEAGDDIVYVSKGADRMGGGAGHDVLSFEFMEDSVSADFETDTFEGATFQRLNDGSAALSDFEEAVGSAFNDSLTASSDINVLSGGAGSDSLTGTSGDDQLHAYFGDDAGGGMESNLLDGKGGNDTMTGSNGNDVILAGSGNDEIRLFAGEDSVVAGAGSDVIDLREATGLKVVTADAQEGQINRFLLGFNPLGLGGVFEQLDSDLLISAYEEGESLPYLVVAVTGYFDFASHRRIELEYTDPALGEGAVPLVVTADTIQAKLAGHSVATGGSDVLTVSSQDFATVQGGDGGVHASFDGGSGDDNIVYVAGSDEASGPTPVTRREIKGGSGDDSIMAGAGITHIYGGSGHDHIVADAADSKLFGDDGNDTIIGNGELKGGDGNDEIIGGSGGDLLSGNLGNDRLHGKSGGDTLIGNAGNDTLEGGLGDDRLYGYQDNDSLLGGEGADELHGMDGEDTFDGGDGKDTIVGGGGADLIYASYGRDSIQGGGGQDTLSFERIDEAIHFDMPGGAFEVEAENRFGPVEFTSVSGVEKVVGSKYDDLIAGHDGLHELHGGEGNDGLIGTAAKDTLDGGAGDDLLMATAGGDELIGGEGQDTVSLYQLGSGTNIDVTSGQLPFGIAIAALDGIEALETTKFNDTIRAGAGFDKIEAAEGDDVLYGSNTGTVLEDGTPFGVALDGGDGNDLFHAASGGDTFIGGEGTDTADFGAFAGGVTLDFQEGDFAAKDEARDGSLGLKGVGGVEVALGTLADDHIVAGRGVTTVDAKDGDDTLSGSEADETLIGGAGDDSFIAYGGMDSIDGGGGRDTLSFEKLGSGVNFNFGAVDEFFTLGGPHGFSGVTGIEVATGSKHADVITTGGSAKQVFGMGGNDLLVSGSSAIDTLNGGEGDDRFDIADDADILIGGAGYDTVRFTHRIEEPGLLWSLDFGLEEARFQGVEAAEGTETGDNLVAGGSVQDLYGREGDDIFSGSTANNLLDGGAGDDFFIVDQGGVDTVHGGAGYDTLSFSVAGNALNLDFSAGDIVTWNADGASVAHSGIEEVHGDAVHDDVIVAGAQMISLLGLGGNDRLDGNALGNQLLGFSGNDTLMGYAGNDTLKGGDGRDVIHAGDDNDMVLGGNGNDYLDGGNGDDTVSGHAGNDTVYGFRGNDTLDGGDGDDKLYGMMGNDVLMASEGNDTYDGGSGFDILSFDNMVDSAPQGLQYLHGSVTGVSGFTATSFVDVEGITGTQHGDSISVYSSDPFTYVDAGGGDDTVVGYGYDSAFTAIGGAGNDMLSSHAGGELNPEADHFFGDSLIDLTPVVIGGSVNDLDLGSMTDDGDDTLTSAGMTEYLVGGGGNDTYDIVADRTWHTDIPQNVRIIDAAGNDSLKLTTAGDTNPYTEGAWDQVWFRKVDGEDLQITYDRDGEAPGISTITVEGWFAEGGQDFKLEQISVDNVNVISAAGVDALVSVMQHYDDFEFGSPGAVGKSVRQVAAQHWQIVSA